MAKFPNTPWLAWDEVENKWVGAHDTYIRLINKKGLPYRAIVRKNPEWRLAKWREERKKKLAKK